MGTKNVQLPNSNAITRGISIININTVMMMMIFQKNDIKISPQLLV
jgi:hypothetical protein